LPTPTDSDWDGYEIHISDTSGFTPSDSTLKAKGKQTSFDITDLPTKTYYVKAISYDTSGNKSAPSNEVSCTSSPILSPYEGRIQYDTFFDSIDGLLKYTVGSGSVSLNVNGYYVELSGAAKGDIARLSYNAYFRIETADWSKIRRMKTKIQLRYPSYNDFYIGVGSVEAMDYLQKEHIGFRLNGYDGTLYGSVGNGTVETTTQLWTLDNTEGATYVLEFVASPQRVYFYLNNQLRGSIDYYLPRGTNYAAIFLNIVLKLTDSATRYIRLSEWHFVQEA